MLKDNLFTTTDHSSQPGQVDAKISFNPDHEIFKGHFPGLPVVPGVCMMQIAREILEFSLGCHLAIVAADNMKFMSVIDPSKVKEVEVKVGYIEEGDNFFVNASLFLGDIIFFKLKGTLSKVPWK